MKKLNEEQIRENFWNDEFFRSKYFINNFSKFSDDFIVKYADKINFYDLQYRKSFLNNCSKELIFKLKDNIPWGEVIYLLHYNGIRKAKFIFTEDILDSVIKKLRGIEWEILCEYNLPEAFIIKHKIKLGWKNICKYQKLPYDFILKYKEKLGIKYLILNQDITADFIKENLQEFNMSFEIIQKNIKSNKNMSKENKKNILQVFKKYGELL